MGRGRYAVWILLPAIWLNECVRGEKRGEKRGLHVVSMGFQEVTGSFKGVSRALMNFKMLGFQEVSALRDVPGKFSGN